MRLVRSSLLRSPFQARHATLLPTNGVCGEERCATSLEATAKESRSAYHLHGKTGYSGVNSNGTGHPNEFFFRGKGNTFRRIYLLLSRFNRDFRKFPYHLSITCCRAPWATLCRFGSCTRHSVTTTQCTGTTTQ